MLSNSWVESWCADGGVGTYDLLRTDPHKKDGYSHEFP
jgi:hypothetical protein